MSKKDETLLEGAKERYKTADEGWRDIYAAALDDLHFVYDVGPGQWPEEIRKDRGDRPSLTINKLLKFVRQMRGDSRQNRPRIKVIPVDDAADVQRAELYNGLIRQIEYLSSAEVAYDTAYMNAVSASIGFFRIITEYSDPYGFEQDIKIKRVMNPFAVRFDPSPKEFDLSDAAYCFIEEVMTKKDFEAQYKGAKSVGFDGQTIGQQYTGWFDKDTVRVAEYFYKEETKKKLGLVEFIFPNGMTQTISGILTPEIIEMIGAGKARLLQERETVIREVKWAKMTGEEVLERQDWPGKDIPVIPVMGDEVVVNGKRHILSLIRGAKGPQQMYNYWSTSATETVALAPKSPYMVAAKQVEGFEGEWQEANRKNRMFLRYKHIPGMQKPSREHPPQIPTGIVAMMQNTAFELEDQLGRYEASKGAPSNERSGIAIQARVAQSDKGTFTFVDNFSRAIIFAGRQLIDLIPKIYDTERAVRVQGEDGNEQLVRVNQNTGQLDAAGKPMIMNDLTVGKYDLIATVGASYSSRRQEMLDMMIKSMQYAPTVAPALAPLIFKYSDWPGAEEVSNAIKQAVADAQEVEAQRQAVQ